jgi:NSS family neurotransmitter:Na+ symporter
MAQEKVLGVMQQGNEGLTFKWIPTLFSKVPSGNFFLALFFLALCFAAFSSLISQLELISRIFMDTGLTRKKAVTIVGTACFVLGIPSAVSIQSGLGVGIGVDGQRVILHIPRTESGTTKVPRRDH